MSIVSAPAREIIHTGYVQLSVEHPCPQCATLVRMVGEHKPNGNWYCPSCGFWTPLNSEEGSKIIVWKRAQKVVDADILFPAGSEPA